MADIKTGGGSNVGRDVETGNDYVGRDKFNVGDGATSAAIGSGNRVEIHTGARGERHGTSDADLIESLQRAIGDITEMKIALLGSPWNPRAEPGLVRIVNLILDEQQVARDERKSLGEEQAKLRADVTSRISSAMTLTWVSLLVVGFIGLMMIYMLVT